MITLHGSNKFIDKVLIISGQDNTIIVAINHDGSMEELEQLFYEDMEGYRCALGIDGFQLNHNQFKKHYLFTLIIT
jgi:hypothetical protein